MYPISKKKIKKKFLRKKEFNDFILQLLYPIFRTFYL
jgi:hypothetical protein